MAEPRWWRVKALLIHLAVLVLQMWLAIFSFHWKEKMDHQIYELNYV